MAKPKNPASAAQCLYQTLFCFLYSLFLLLLAEHLYAYGIPLLSKLAYGLFLSFLFCLIHNYPKLGLVLRIFITGGLFYYALSILSRGGLLDALKTCNAFAFWFVRRFPDGLSFDEPLFPFFFCLLIILGVSLTLRWKCPPSVFFLVGITLIVYIRLIGLSVSFGLYALFFILVFTHMAVTIHQKSAQKGGRMVSPLRYALAALPLCVLALLLALLIPTPARPPGLVAAERIGAGSLLSDLFARDYGADLSYTALTGGLSDGRLGGGRPNQSDTVLFTVKTDKPAYLSFKHYDAYHASRWTSTFEDTQPLPSYDSFWKGRPVAENEWVRRQLGLLSRLPRLQTQTIVFQSLRTQSLLIANQTVAVNADLSLTETEAGDVYAAVSQGRGFTYTLIDHDEWPDRAELNAVLRVYSPIQTEPAASYFAPDGSAVPATALGVPDAYTALPDSLPARVGELAQTIAQEQTNSVDIAYTLIDYLHENYTYTLDVPRTPSDRDFVDYFLFDMDKGYCTYFASALAVMLRTLDIPCRYVEGFLPPSAPSSDGAYAFTGRMAHAWVEIYFPVIDAWIPFEPTPPAGLTPDAPVSPPAPVSPTSAPSLSPSLFPTPSVSAAPSPSPAPAPEDTKAGFPWGWLLTVAGLGVAFAAGQACRRRRKLRYTHTPTSGKMTQLYRRALRYARRARLRPLRTETPLEFGARADAALHTGLYTQAGALYAKTLFSGQPPTQAELHTLFAAVTQLPAVIKAWKKERRHAKGR